MTPFQLYQWAVDNVPGVHFCYCSTEEYERQKNFLQTWFEQTRTIPGTSKLHSFIPISKDTLMTRIYSFSTITRENWATKLPAAGDLELEEVSGSVTCSYNSQWWLGWVLETHTKEVQTSLTLLHPPSPSLSYKYPDVPVIVTLPLTEILIKVCPLVKQDMLIPLLRKRLKLQWTNWKLEYIEFLSLLYVSFCQCILYYVLMCFSVLALTTTSSPDPIVPKQLIPHKAR